MAIIQHPWTLSVDAILKTWNIDLNNGLSDRQVIQHRQKFGPNRLQETKPKNPWTILWNQLKSLIVFLLAGAAIVAFLFHEIPEGFAIVAVILINALIGFFTEIRAVRSMEALKKLGGVSAKVRRNGQVREVPAEDLMPGDIVILEGGDLASADMRLITASKLEADESSLTGESLPVDKSPESLDAEVPLADRKNMLYKGTSLTRGSGEAIVVATGMYTELGKISSMIQQADEESTPLEERLKKLGQSLVWVTLIIAVLVAVSGIINGKEPFEMIETAIALAVAAIPEGLPIVATIALARGMFRMAKKNALIRKLSAVETLGATTVIFTDKTGTLTENRMTLSRIVLPSVDVEIRHGLFYRNNQKLNHMQPDLQIALETGVLCNNASIQKEAVNEASGSVGDPLEISLLQAALDAGINVNRFRQDHPEEREDAFDSVTKRMATFNRFGKKYRVSIKGALEAILDDCHLIWDNKNPKSFDKNHKNVWIEINNQMGQQGLRIITLAMKEVRSLNEDPYKNAVFLGLLGIQDPPREDVKTAIQACRTAGIQVIMVTGDQPVTAKNIGDTVGLTAGTSGKVIHSTDLMPLASMPDHVKSEVMDTPIFARVSPEQKLDLITLYQEQGNIVAMTGDGVNDAPALKKADIGVAMGLRGTQVAQEAADMVLKDDSFSTIVTAIKEGRIIFGNIRKAVQFLLSCNISEVLVVGLASLANTDFLPIRPLQILFLNLVTDVFPALALSVGEGDPDIMKQQPRSPKESILGHKQWMGILGFGFLMTVSVIGALAIALEVLKMEEDKAISVSFLTLAFNQIWHPFNMRERGSSFFKNEITRNPMIWGAVVICTGLLLGAVYGPGLADILELTDPGKNGWLLILGASLFPWTVGQIVKSLPGKKT